MERKLNDPAVKQGFKTIVSGARDNKELETIAKAEQVVIAFYYDMLCAMTLRRMKPDVKRPFPDPAPVRNAVTEINRACANQKRNYLFTGKINNPADLFAFASGIAMPVAKTA